MQKLTAAREKRGWGFLRAAEECGITSQQLRNLERQGGPSRDTIPGKVTAFTMVSILETFPELDLADFVSGTKLSVRKR